MAGAGTSREAIVREQEKGNLENFLNDIPLPKDVYFEFASDAWRSIKLKEFVAKAPMMFDYRIMTEGDESTWGGQHFERPFFYVVSCGVGGCKQKGWPNCSGAWSYISDVRCRIAYAVHLVKHGAHNLDCISALCRAFDYKITKTTLVFETFKERAQHRKMFRNNTQQTDIYPEELSSDDSHQMHHCYVDVAVDCPENFRSRMEEKKQTEEELREQKCIAGKRSRAMLNPIDNSQLDIKVLKQQITTLGAQSTAVANSGDNVINLFVADLDDCSRKLKKMLSLTMVALTPLPDIIICLQGAINRFEHVTSRIQANACTPETPRYGFHSSESASRSASRSRTPAGGPIVLREASRHRDDHRIDVSPNPVTKHWAQKRSRRREEPTGSSRDREAGEDEPRNKRPCRKMAAAADEPRRRRQRRRFCICMHAFPQIYMSH